MKIELKEKQNKKKNNKQTNKQEKNQKQNTHTHTKLLLPLYLKKKSVKKGEIYKSDGREKFINYVHHHSQ